MRLQQLLKTSIIDDLLWFYSKSLFVGMKSKILLLNMLLCMLSSCSEDEIPLGGNFLLYKQDGNRQYFSCIGLDVGGGGTQRLIKGEIESYGYDSAFVVVRMKNDLYYFFEKAAVNSAARPTEVVQGPLSPDEYQKRAAQLKLPPLIYTPNK